MPGTSGSDSVIKTRCVELRRPAAVTGVHFDVLRDVLGRSSLGSGTWTGGHVGRGRGQRAVMTLSQLDYGSTSDRFPS